MQELLPPNLHWQKLLITAIAAWLTPIAGALQTGGNIHVAVLSGMGMAIAAMVGFVQQPSKT